MNCNSHFTKFAKNGASNNKNPQVRNVQWGSFYSKFVEKKIRRKNFSPCHTALVAATVPSTCIH